jgi:glycosyltransferase involved in cell wall biosynthesis
MTYKNSYKGNWILLKNNISNNDYFSELCEEVSNFYGYCIVYSGTKSWEPKGNINFTKGPFYNKKSLVTKFLSWISYFLGSFFFLVGQKKSANLFIINSPPFLSALGYLFNKIFGMNYIIWVDDIYPDVLSSRNFISKNGFIEYVWNTFNKIIYRNATHVITISHFMGKKISSKMGSSKNYDKINIIPTWVDANEIYPIKKKDNPFAIKYNQVDKITVMYSGNFGSTHDTRSLVKVAEALQDITEINFFFIGEGQEFEKLRNKYRLGNTVYLPWQPRSNLKFSLSCADIGLVTLKKGMGQLSMPSKTYYYMAAGAAIMGVSEVDSNLNFLIEKHKCGFNFPPDKFDEIINKILFYRENKNILLEHQNLSRRFVMKSVSKDICLKKVLKLMKSGI